MTAADGESGEQALASMRRRTRRVIAENHGILSMNGGNIGRSLFSRGALCEEDNQCDNGKCGLESAVINNLQSSRRICCPSDEYVSFGLFHGNVCLHDAAQNGQPYLARGEACETDSQCINSKCGSESAMTNSFVKPLRICCPFDEYLGFGQFTGDVCMMYNVVSGAEANHIPTKAPSNAIPTASPYDAPTNDVDSAAVYYFDVFTANYAYNLYSALPWGFSSVEAEAADEELEHTQQSILALDDLIVKYASESLGIRNFGIDGLYGLDSMPKDRIQYNVANPCLNSTTVLCTPVSGGLTVEYDSERISRDEATEHILNAIEKGMEQDDILLKGSSVKWLTYVGPVHNLTESISARGSDGETFWGSFQQIEDVRLFAVMMGAVALLGAITATVTHRILRTSCKKDPKKRQVHHGSSVSNDWGGELDSDTSSKNDVHILRQNNEGNCDYPPKGHDRLNGDGRYWGEYFDAEMPPTGPNMIRRDPSRLYREESKMGHSRHGGHSRKWEEYWEAEVPPTAPNRMKGDREGNRCMDLQRDRDHLGVRRKKLGEDFDTDIQPNGANEMHKNHRNRGGIDPTNGRDHIDYQRRNWSEDREADRQQNDATKLRQGRGGNRGKDSRRGQDHLDDRRKNWGVGFDAEMLRQGLDELDDEEFTKKEQNHVVYREGKRVVESYRAQNGAAVIQKTRAKDPKRGRDDLDGRRRKSGEHFDTPTSDDSCSPRLGIEVSFPKWESMCVYPAGVGIRVKEEAVGEDFSLLGVDFSPSLSSM